MDVIQIAFAIVGAISIFLGYRLFCDGALGKTRMIQLASGALLAIFGVAILSADLISVRSRSAPEIRPNTHHAKPAGTHRHNSSTAWLA
jgi:hypothetical protein